MQIPKFCVSMFQKIGNHVIARDIPVTYNSFQATLTRLQSYNLLQMLKIVATGFLGVASP